MKKLLALVLALALCLGLVSFAHADDLIKVGVVNNPPSESGYRAANVADFESVFTAENGYELNTFYSIKNDEQLQAATGFITDGVDVLLISAAETTGWDETLDLSKPYRYIDPEQPWKQRSFEHCTAKELQTLVVKDGKRVAPPQPLMEIQSYVKKQLQEEIWEEEQRFENPHQHYLDMSPSYYEMKMDLLSEAKTSNKE